MNQKVNKRSPRVAVIGATGMVGRELIRILEERSFKLSQLDLFASSRSSGEVIEFKGDELPVVELVSADQIDADIAFFGAGSKVSLDFIDKLVKKGCICIDKSSAYRMRDGVPLVVPEVNGHLLASKKYHIIASPNCVATPLVQVLSPIHKMVGLDQVVVSTYQAVSGAGKEASDELESQVRDLFNMRDVKADIFGKRIAFNVLPFIPARGAVDDFGKTDEEIKLIEETKKILGLAELKMEATCVRVPVFNGHSMSVTISTKMPIKIKDALDTLSKSPGIMIIDNPEQQSYPTPIDACGEDVTLVGRIRPNTSVEHGLTLWISSDNLRGGAALNAVRIAENLDLE
jgi:aspartate-semialdehyde dehydrogenase